MALSSAPLRLDRNGKFSGIQFPLPSNTWSIQGFPAKGPALERVLETGATAALAKLREIAPGVAAELEQDLLDGMSAKKLEGMRGWWAKQGKSLENWKMPMPGGFKLDENDQVRFLYEVPEVDPVAEGHEQGRRRFNELMAVRDAFSKLTPEQRGALADWVAEQVMVREPVTPAIRSTSLGGNALPVVPSTELNGRQVTVLTIQGAASMSEGKVVSTTGKVGSIGGAVTLEQDAPGNDNIDVATVTDRELCEEVGVSLPWARGGYQPFLMLQDDLQVSVGATIHFVSNARGEASRADERKVWARFRETAYSALHAIVEGRTAEWEQTHQQRLPFALDEKYLATAEDRQRTVMAISDALLQADGPSLELLKAIRPYAKDANESVDLVGLPRTKEAYTHFLSHPKVDPASWTAVMLVADAERSFGRDFAEQLADSVSTPEKMRATHAESRRIATERPEVAADVAFVDTQLDTVLGRAAEVALAKASLS